MENIKKQPFQNQYDSQSLISLFLRGYLRMESLRANRKAEKLLKEMDDGRVGDREKWSGLLGHYLASDAVRTLVAVLERPLTGEELLSVFERIDAFIRSYRPGAGTPRTGAVSNGGEAGVRGSAPQRPAFPEGNEYRFKKGDSLC